uniref:Uncharacterized protein n=1 Tax=Cynoglossus semilaevis TaxID=244447 RepID=A0A3P8X3E6_CYNSE
MKLECKDLRLTCDLQNDCLKKTCKFPQSLMIWAYMSGKGEIAVITSSMNAQVYVDILDTFLIPSIERAQVCMLIVYITG